MGGSNRPWTLNIPLMAVLLFCVVVLIAVPIFLLQRVVFLQARENVEADSQRMTLGMLEAAQERLTQMMETVRLEVEGLDGPPDSLRPDALRLSAHLQSVVAIGELLIFDLEGGEGVRIGTAGIPSEIRLDPAAGEDTLLVIQGDTSRRVWLGHVPFYPPASDGLWMIGAAGERQGHVFALSLGSEFLDSFLATLALRTSSEIFLVTLDNAVLQTGDTDFFAQAYAPLALSRTESGKFIHYVSTAKIDGATEEVLVRVFADPHYLFNFVAVTPRRALIAPVVQAIAQTTILTAIVGALVILVATAIIAAIARRVGTLTSALDRVGGGDYAVDLWQPRIGISEVEHVRQGIVTSSRMLAERDASLQEARESLERKVAERTQELMVSLEQLRAAQDILVQSEKMAALGRTVGAFTHEIANPIGVGTTAASLLVSTLQEAIRALQERTMPADGLSEALRTAQDAADLISRNLAQASRITGRLKHLATDQSVQEVRRFNLWEYLDDIVTSLGGRAKKVGAAISLTGDQALELYGDPSVLYQIFSNLILNSLDHGFSPDESGGSVDDCSISIDVRAHAEAPGTAEIVYRDNGRGMDANVLSRMYEPYYTTTRASGGTGLGMSVVYTAVTRDLGGSIQCVSSPGNGVIFTITIPLSLGDSHG